jgi:hypothetical protein
MAILCLLSHHMTSSLLAFCSSAFSHTQQVSPGFGFIPSGISDHPDWLRKPAANQQNISFSTSAFGSAMAISSQTFGDFDDPRDGETRMVKRKAVYISELEARYSKHENDVGRFW